MFSDGWLQTGNYLHNPLQPLNSFGLKKSELKQGLHRNSTGWSVWRTERSIWNRAYRPQFRQKRKRSRSPAGPRHLRNSDTHKRVAVPKAFCVLLKYTQPRPKSGKVCCLSPGHAGFQKRVKQSEGSDSTPIRNARVSPCEPLCAILLAKASVYPLSPVKANVGRLWEKLNNAIRNGWG